MALFRAICLLLCVHSESQTKSMIFSTCVFTLGVRRGIVAHGETP